MELYRKMGRGNKKNRKKRWCGTPLEKWCGKKSTQEKKNNNNTPTTSGVVAHHSWCGFLCLLDRANLQTHPAPYTNTLIDLRVLKSLFIFYHFNGRLRAYRIARCAATAVFFSFVKNWYIFHCCFSFICFFATSIPQP